MQKSLCTEMNTFAHLQLLYSLSCILSRGRGKKIDFLQDFYKKIAKRGWQSFFVGV